MHRWSRIESRLDQTPTVGAVCRLLTIITAALLGIASPVQAADAIAPASANPVPGAVSDRVPPVFDLESCKAQSSRVLSHLNDIDARDVLFRDQLQAYGKGASGHCLVEGMILIRRPLAAGPVAERVLVTEQSAAGFAQLVADDASAPIFGRDSGEAFGICIVRALPAEAWALFATPPGSPEERAAIQRMMPGIKSCIDQGRQMTLNLTSLRAELDIGAYRLAYGYDGHDPEMITRNAEAERLAMKYGRCLALTKPQLAAPILFVAAGDRKEREDFKQLLEKTELCADKLPAGSQMAIPHSLLRGALAEQLYLLQFDGRNIGILKARASPSPAAVADPPAEVSESEKTHARRYLLALADCVVTAAPDTVYKIVQTLPASDGESAALTALQPTLTACLGPKGEMPANIPLLRAALSEALYMTSLRANAAASSKTS